MVMLGSLMLSVFNALWCNADCCQTECHYAERHYVKRRYVKRRNTECNGAVQSTLLPPSLERFVAKSNGYIYIEKTLA
jgi:hypothetical protein